MKSEAAQRFEHVRQTRFQVSFCSGLTVVLGLTLNPDNSILYVTFGSYQEVP
jgi:hypothetical protein